MRVPALALAPLLAVAVPPVIPRASGQTAPPVIPRASGQTAPPVIPRAPGQTAPEGSAGVADPSSPGRTASRRDDGAPTPDTPYRASPSVPLAFRGPGRDEPEPDVPEVVIGWFGPGDPDHPRFGDFWKGALVALERENGAGGHRGKPFRLVPAWSENPWRAGVVEVARLVQEKGAWAVVGGVDGTTTHLAVQLALKSRFPLVSPGSTDVTADHAHVPWLFSLPPSDAAIAEALAGAAAAARGGVAVAAGTDHDSHALLVALRRALGARGLAPSALVEVADEVADPAGAVGQVLVSKPATLLVLAPPSLAGRLVGAARAAAFEGPIVGGPGLSIAAFARAAGRGAEGVRAPLLAQVAGAEPELVEAYARRWGEAPDAAALLGHDAVRLVARAVRRAGLNRARIGDEIRGLAPWEGAAGRVRWDARGRNETRAPLGTWRSGLLLNEERAAAQ